MPLASPLVNNWSGYGRNDTAWDASYLGACAASGISVVGVSPQHAPLQFPPGFRKAKTGENYEAD